MIMGEIGQHRVMGLSLSSQFLVCTPHLQPQPFTDICKCPSPSCFHLLAASSTSLGSKCKPEVNR